MKWVKRGLVYSPRPARGWHEHSALQPTPILLRERLRVFVGMRDGDGVSRVGWVDLDPADPTKVLAVSEQPALDVGRPGEFDEFGVVPCAVVWAPEGLRLYYAGYSRGHRVPFLAFGGMASSRDDGRTFTRADRVPITDRTSEEPLFRVIHSILREGSGWRVWYGGGDRFVADGEDRLHPSYDIRTMTSPDGIRFPATGQVALPCRSDGGEYRVGRPYVVRDGERLRMFFGAGSFATRYRLAYAESDDGVHWLRKDQDLALELSPDGWDSEMMAYPALVSTPAGFFLLYNGNDMGRHGFGCAELLEW